MRRIWLVALVACSGGAKTTIANTGGKPPTGPAPSIAWAEGSFTVVGLPAVTSDGSRVAIAYQGEDGARGLPNLALIVRDRNDADIERQEVLEDTVSTDDPKPTATAIDTANKYLAATHQQYGWRELAESPAHPADGSDTNLPYTDAQKATGGDVEIRFDRKGHLTIAQGGKTVVDRDEPKWLAPSSPECVNPAFLSDAWIDGARKLALLRISYAGSDSCWEPDSEPHVVAW